MHAVNLSGLNDEQLALVDRYADFLRARKDPQVAARELQQLLARREDSLPELSEDEVARLADDAVAFARAHR